MTPETYLIVGGLIAVVLAVLIAILVFKFKKRLPLTSDEKLQPPAPVVPVPAPKFEPQKPARVGFLNKVLASWAPLFEGNSKDREAWEEALIRSDMGPKLADELLTDLQKSDLDPKSFFVTRLKEILKPSKASVNPWTEAKPWVCFVVGVNGVGKTSSVVKLGAFLKSQSKRVAVVGADTFRKAAIEQLERGCEMAELDFFAIKSASDESEGADPSAVIFDGLKKFADYDVILVDTSGRLHTKKNLMDELKKMKRVADKVIPGAPQDVWLVLDSTLGQNTLQQAQVFDEAVQLTGLILTKLDGLSRGGTIFQLFQSLKKPILFFAHGENVNDISLFDPDNFVEELFDLKAS